MWYSGMDKTFNREITYNNFLHFMLKKKKKVKEVVEFSQ